MNYTFLVQLWRSHTLYDEIFWIGIVLKTDFTFTYQILFSNSRLMAKTEIHVLYLLEDKYESDYLIASTFVLLTTHEIIATYKR